MDDDDDDADALRVMLAKAHYEVVAKRHIDEIASALVDFDDINDTKTNRLDALWGNAHVGFDDEATTTAARRARSRRWRQKKCWKKSLASKTRRDTGRRGRRASVLMGKTDISSNSSNGFFCNSLCWKTKKTARKLRRDVLNEEMSLLKWREARVKEKKKHAEKRMRIEREFGFTVRTGIDETYAQSVERFVRGVEEGLKKKEYAPTFREVLEQVRKVMEKQNGKLAVEIAAEYAMLHLGGAKYRAKKFALPSRRGRGKGKGKKWREDSERRRRRRRRRDREKQERD